MLNFANTKAAGQFGGLCCFEQKTRSLRGFLACCALLYGIVAVSSAQQTPAAPQQANTTALTASDIADLRSKAEAGDASAQTKLATAYRKGDGVSTNDTVAVQWFRKAADQGFGPAENNLGTMYRLGDGVSRDKEEAFRWYLKAARHGSPEGMFNVGTCYYNGDGVGSNEFTAYAWFILSYDAGNPVAKDAVERTAATMSKADTAGAYLKIAEMYDKGVELPQDETQVLRWMHKAADLDFWGKVRLAVRLLTGPEKSRNYAEALQLCKETKDYPPAFPCVGYIYRKGLGVPADPVEAAKWYQQGAAKSNDAAIMVMAEMYQNGEGVKVDRPAAFMLLFRGTQMGIAGAHEKARQLLAQLDKRETAEVIKRLKAMHLDPTKSFEAIQSNPRSPSP